jgi:hypothetical protein
MALEFAHGAIQWLSADTATTTYTVSGLSFQPKAIRFYWVGLQSATDAASQAVNERRGVGFASSTSSRRSVGTFSQDTAGTSNCGGVASNDCVACTTDGAGARDGLLDINAFNSDGFQLIVDDATPANITVFWEAWGGADITDVTIGDIAEPAATGTQDYTATGFTSTDDDSQVVMFAGCQSTAAVNTAAAADSGLVVGYSTGTASTENIVVTGNSDDASSAMDTDGYGLDSECLANIVLAGGNPNARATLSAFGTDLFTLNWTARGTTNRRYVYMAIKGGSWSAGSYTINGNTGSATATVSGLAFTPVGVSLIGRMTTESTAGTSTANDRIGIGTGSSTSSRRSMGILDENATASSACEIDVVVEYDQVLAFPSTAGALLSAYDINAMNSDGFQIIVDTAGGVASEWQGYLTYGDAPAASESVSPSSSVSPSVSPSTSISPSVSPSASTSPSVSVSPSTSPSASTSPSPSASTSPSVSASPSTSPSASTSPSVSISPSTSPSTSTSPSVSPSTSLSPSVSTSPSVSVSPSASPSPSPGWSVYSRGDEVSLPANDNNLETTYTSQDETDVSTSNNVRVSQIADGQYAIHLFKDYVGSGSACTLNWEGQTNVAPSTSTVYLQIYNQNSTTWETVDSDNTSSADTDFVLTANISDLTNYRLNGAISCRVYQLSV